MVADKHHRDGNIDRRRLAAVSNNMVGVEEGRDMIEYENPMVLYTEPEMVEIERCEDCHEIIYEGYGYYDIEGRILCEDCAHEWLDQFWKVAEAD